MKFKFEWLKKLLALDMQLNTVAEKITAAGLELESIEGDKVTLKVAPNRADCLGMVGLSRDVAAIVDTHFNEPVVKKINAQIDDKMNVKVIAAKACPKYLSRVIKGIDNTKETPQWIKDCLTVAGINIISPIVDITNYVLLEWGQPLHAFDMRKIDGNIIVRMAKDDEKLTLLDESIVQLNKDTLIIADDNKPLAIAGVKGGMDSGIAPDTKDIVIECAYFEPVGIRLTSRHYGLKTDGAYRFERCIDPNMQETVMEHVTQVILDTVGGTPGPVVSVVATDYLPQTVVLSLRISRIAKILGIKIDTQTVINILKRLGFVIETHNGDDELMVTVPSYRQDIAKEIDLIEEVARIYGFDKIPALPIQSSLDFKPMPEEKIQPKEVMDCLINRGYHEVITYSFIDINFAKHFTNNLDQELQLTNPISSEMGFMRPSLLPGLVKTIMYNQNRQQERIRLFEIGLRFNKNGSNIVQTKTIAGACYGNFLPEGWGAPKRLVDLFDVKGDVEALIKLAKLKNLEFKRTTNIFMHPGQTIEVYADNKRLGVIGVLHPQLQQTLELPQPIIMFELDYDVLTNANIPHFKAFSKFPIVRRDIAILVDQKVAAQQILDVVKRNIGTLLTDVVIFDIYQGKGIAPEQRSMALGVSLQNEDRTLTDVEVNDIFTKLISTLQSEIGAVLR